MSFEEVMSLLATGEFIGRGPGASPTQLRWYFGRLDTKGVFLPHYTAETLDDLARLIQESKQESTLQQLRSVGIM